MPYLAKDCQELALTTADLDDIFVIQTIPLNQAIGD